MTGRILLPPRLGLDHFPLGDRHLRRPAVAGRAPRFRRQLGARPRVDFVAASEFFLAEGGLDIAEVARICLPPQVVTRIEASPEAKYRLEGGYQN
jgi:hypothetical protein